MDRLPDFKVYADQLAEVAHWAARQGWAPATSTNYSLRLPAEAHPAICAITPSGVDKEHLDPGDVVAVDRDGRPLNGRPRKPSAETLLHMMLYRRSEVGAVFHTHSMAGALLSRKMEAAGHITFSGWELLKGLEGVDRHDCEVRLPVFPNSQDIAGLAAYIEPRLSSAGTCHGFLLAGHGLYAWGTSLSEAKRHLEVFEYLLQCEREVRHHGHHTGA